MRCLQLNRQYFSRLASYKRASATAISMTFIVLSACNNQYKHLTVVSPAKVAVTPAEQFTPGTNSTTDKHSTTVKHSTTNKHLTPDEQSTIVKTTSGFVQQLTDYSPSCILRFKPTFTSTLYNTQVNVVGRHLSGLLLFKQMPDSSMRVVFSSEMGVKFFDFGFGNDGGFTVYQVMKQLDKPSVIKTLRSDFELLMMRNLSMDSAVVKKDSAYIWVGFPSMFKNGRPKETHYYITDQQCTKLVRIENAMKRKPKVLILMDNYHNGVPDTIGITHKNFNFNIGLKYIQR